MASGIANQGPSRHQSTQPRWASRWHLSKCFQCVTGPALVVVGRMFFSNVTQAASNRSSPPIAAASPSLIAQVGHQIDPSDPVQKQRLGRICVGSGGHDAPAIAGARRVFHLGSDQGHIRATQAMSSLHGWRAHNTRPGGSARCARSAQPGAFRHGACRDGLRWSPPCYGKRRAGRRVRQPRDRLAPAASRVRKDKVSRSQSPSITQALEHRPSLIVVGPAAVVDWVAVWPPALCLSNLNGNRRGFAIAVGCHLFATLAVITARSSAVNDRRRSSQQPRSRQGRVDFPSLSLGRRCSAQFLSPVIATAVRALRSEGDRVIRIAPATLVLPPGLPCLAAAGASSDLASRPAPGLAKAWCLLLTREVLSRPRASACASGETQGHRWWLRHLTPPKSLLALRGPSTARGACGQ